MKCILCRKDEKAGLDLKMKEGYILCTSCQRRYSWNSSGRWLRERKPQQRWKHQEALHQTLRRICRADGEDPRRVVTEVGFPDWGMSSMGGLLRFDICLPHRKILVDYHGQQHYDPESTYHRKAGSFRRQQINDQRKREAAPEASWSYIIFNYREDVEDEAWVRKKLEKIK